MSFLLSSLTFSDSAKFAEAARNFIAGDGFTIHHSFFSPTTLASCQPGQAWPASFLPFASFILSLAFKVLPINDSTVSLVGYFFFVLCLYLVFLIAKKLHSIRTGIVASLLFASSLYFFEYAQNASSEIFFTFEILFFVYLVLLRNRFSAFAIFPLVLMFLTRQQAIIFLLTLPAYFITFKLKSWRSRIILLLSALLFFIGFFKLAKTDVSSIYSPLNSFYSAQTASTITQGQYLRGLTYSSISSTFKDLIIKTFYNLYNFLKSPERLASPAIFLLLIFSFFVNKNRQFAYFTGTAFLLFVVGAAASLPNARYVHPIIPLVVICASLALVQILEKLSPKRLNLKLLCVISFILLPTLGHFTLDARFRRQQFNTNKPPVYREISQVMAKHIPKDRLIITNLDAWAAWYEGLTTMWFPLSPDLLAGHQDKVAFIVITNYQENDADFALGPWSEVVYSPHTIQDPFLRQNYRVLTTFEILASAVYENHPYQGTILVRNGFQN